MSSRFVLGCLLPAIVRSELPPGYEDVAWCPADACLADVSQPSGFVGPQSSFKQCYTPSTAVETDEVWTGSQTNTVAPTGWVQAEPCQGISLSSSNSNSGSSLPSPSPPPPISTADDSALTPQDVLERIVDIATQLGQAAVAALQWAWPYFQQGIQAAAQATQSFLEWLGPVVQDILQTLRPIVQSAVQAFSAAVQNLIDTIQDNRAASDTGSRM